MQEVHVSKISNSKQFSLGEIKQFLPIHQPNIIENLRIIFNNYALSNYPRNISLVPDESLTLSDSVNSVFYTNLRAIWAQDSDESHETLRSSLNLGCSLLNYIGSIDEQILIEEHQREHESFAKRVEILSFVNTQRIQQKKKYYNNIKHLKKILGFRFLNTNGRIYLLIGINVHSKESFVLSCALLRRWNLSRLKMPESVHEFEIDLAHRVCEHLFSIGRGFIREISNDYNSYKAGVNQLLAKLGKEELNLENIRRIFSMSKLQNSTNLTQELLIMKWHVTFRKTIQKNHLWDFICEIVTQWLMHTPLDCSVSYGSHLLFDENLSSVTILLCSHYQASAGHIYPNDTIFSKAASQVQSLLLDYSFRKQDSQTNSLKASIALLTKYQVPPDKSELNLSRQITPPDDTYSNNSLNDSFVSQISNESYSRKVNLKDIAKLENQIYEVLKTIHSKKSILSPSQIEEAIRNYVTKLQARYPLTNLTQQQYQALNVLDGINQLINAQELYLILKKNLTESSLIIVHFLPKGKYQRAIAVGKMIATDYLEDLYKKSLKQGLSSLKHTIIPFYLKKIVQFYVEQNIPVSHLQSQEISIPNLLQILEKKSFNSHFYSSIITVLFPQLFNQYQSVIKVVAPLLYFFAQFLLQHQHHQELVYSFIGDLLFEICYFPTEIKLNSLSNAAYLEDKQHKSLGLKEKKILQLIREGGLKGFGYEFKDQIFPVIQANKSWAEPQEAIYHIIKVEKPNQLLLFYKLLSSCHYTASINKIAKYLEYKHCYASVLTRNTPLICFIIAKNRSNNLEFDIKNKVNQYDDIQFNSISDRILRSESGIFEDMVRLNPKVKLAGIQLKTVMKNLSESKVRVTSTFEKGKLNQQEAVQAYINKQFKQNYEYVSLAWSLKEKYLRYPTLSENEKAYFRDCASAVVEHKTSIFQYVTLSLKMRTLRKTMKQQQSPNKSQKKQVK